MRENAIRITRFLRKTIMYVKFLTIPPEPVFFKDYFRFFKSVLAQTGLENSAILSFFIIWGIFQMTILTSKHMEFILYHNIVFQYI